MGEQSQPQGMKRVRGLGRVYRRGKNWWVQYSFRGQLYRESSGSEKDTAAAALLKRRLGEMGRGRFVGPNVERTTFEDLAKMLVDDYKVNERKSLDRAERSTEHLRGTFGSSRAVDITADRVTAYICSRLETARPATVRLELAALKRMFTLAARAEKVSHRPYFPTIEVRNTRSGFFEEADLRAVLSHLPLDLRVLIEFVYLTGWRIGEAKGLIWRQVDFKGGVVRLEPGSTKNDEGRTFPFEALPPLEVLLCAQRARTRSIERERGQLIQWVFHRGGRPIRDFYMAWRLACKRAGVPGRLIHDLRRTAVRNFERAGVSRSVAMKLSGHKTESVYRRYAIVSEADLAEGVRKVAAMQASSPDAVHRVVGVSEAGNSRTSTIQAQSAKGGRDAQRMPSA